MPEIVEYRKLQRQLVPAWSQNRVTHFTAPRSSPNPRKYLQIPTNYGQELFWPMFVTLLRTNSITGIDRHGKMLYVRLTSGITWQIHLSSTGWFMPGNSAARTAAETNPVHRNFLHGINDATIRVKVHFQDGQIWDYHDGRTWGKWWLRMGRVDGALAPDWLDQPVQAEQALLQHQSKRTAKDVLCDQKVAAGLGNYLSVECLWRAGIHPHTRWHQVSTKEREILNYNIHAFLAESLANADHRHWGVFDKVGEPCPRHPDQPISYAKDGRNGKRGSYFCRNCQAKLE